MYSKVKIAGHAVHPMIIVYPVAFYTAALICFIVYSSNPDIFWFRVAVLANGAGVVMALVAAIPGFIDWSNIPKEKKAKKVGLKHMLLNVTALLLFGINFFLQYKKWDDVQPNESPSIILTGLGLLLTVLAGFHGWNLIQKHHIGVSLTEEQKRLEPKDGVE